MSRLPFLALLFGVALFLFNFASAQHVGNSVFDAMFWTGQQVIEALETEEMNDVARSIGAPRNYFGLSGHLVGAAISRPLAQGAVNAAYEHHMDIIYEPLDSFHRYSTGRVWGYPATYRGECGSGTGPTDGVWYSNTIRSHGLPSGRTMIFFIAKCSYDSGGAPYYSYTISPSNVSTSSDVSQCRQRSSPRDMTGQAPDGTRAGVANTFTWWLQEIVARGACVGDTLPNHIGIFPESGSLIGSEFIPDHIVENGVSRGDCMTGPFGSASSWVPIADGEEDPVACSNGVRVPTLEWWGNTLRIPDYGEGGEDPSYSPGGGSPPPDYNPPPPDPVDDPDPVADLSCVGNDIACESTLQALLSEASRDQDFSGFVRHFEDIPTFTESRWERRDWGGWIPGGGGESGGRVDLGATMIAGVVDEFTAAIDAQLQTIEDAARLKVPFGFISLAEDVSQNVAIGFDDSCFAIPLPDPFNSTIDICDNPFDPFLSGALRTLLVGLVYLGWAISILRLAMWAIP